MDGILYIRSTTFHSQDETTAEVVSKYSPHPSHLLNKSELATGPSELLSQQSYAKLTIYLEQMMYTFQVIAIVFNIINVIVLTRKSLRSQAVYYSVALSVIQLFYVFLSLVSILNNLIRPGPKLNDLFYLVYSVYVANYVMVSVRRCIYCFRCFVSLERLLAVAIPLKAGQFLIVSNPVVFVFTTPVIVGITSIHVCFKLEVFQVENNNSTSYAYRNTNVYLQHPALFEYISLALKVLYEYGLLFLVLVFSVCTILILKGYSRQRKKLNTNVRANTDQMRDRQMTITILVSTSLFILLCLPTATNSAVYNVLTESYGPFSLHRYLFYFLQDFGGVCFVLAFSVDFFTFFALSSTYRIAFFQILRSFKKKSKHRSDSSADKRTSSYSVDNQISNITVTLEKQ